MKPVILYPTDTVYGLGVVADDPEAVLRLIELKGRDDPSTKIGTGNKPISIIVSDMAMAEEYAVVTPLAKKLAKKFLPGKLTFVLEAKKGLAPQISAGTGTVGIRVPNHPVPIQLVHELGKPITATSANVADMPTMKTVPEILAQFGEKSTMIYHNPEWPESLPESLPSTVVDARGEVPLILRKGAIPTPEILAA